VSSFVFSGRLSIVASCLLSVTLAATAIASQAAVAQEFPSRYIRLVVPYAAGATLDTVARVVGDEMAKDLGQPVVVENKPGADAIIGFEYVAKQMPADGYTIVIAAVSGLATLRLTTKELRFDPLKDLPPLTDLVEGKYVFGSSSGQPWKTFKEFVAYARAHPGQLNYGASSTTVRLQTEALLHELGIDVLYVPYRSGAAYIMAVATGEVQMGFVAEGSAITAGERFAALAVTGQVRSATFPDAPTFVELGLPGIRGVRYSLNVRARTPKPVFDRLYTAASRALKQPNLRAQLGKLRLDVVGDTPQVAATRLGEEASVFTAVAKTAGIGPQ
jgi:tripartite-type tricarboxylate transporter receptor subunit TctC